MEQFIINWGYWAVVLGCFFEGETVLVLAGLLAHKGYMKLEWVILAACFGGVCGDQLWFLLGRFAGERLVSKIHRFRKMSDRLTRFTENHGTWFAFGFRFLYGIRSVAPVFLGVSKYPIPKFVVLNLLGAIVWSVVVACLGWFLGASVERLLGRAAHAEEAILAAAVVALSIWIGLRRRRAKEVADAGNVA